MFICVVLRNILLVYHCLGHDSDRSYTHIGAAESHIQLFPCSQVSE